MTDDFTTRLKKVINSEEYRTFKEEHNNYYLAHGFVQLDEQGNESKEWQIGFYSETEDNIATFLTDPVKFNTFEKALKNEHAIIEELTETEKFIKTDKARTIVKEHTVENYPREKITTMIIVIQVIDGKQTYNITAVTESFSMIICKIDAKTGEIVSADKRSVLELKKE
ncbi:MAG: hypothetical protein ACQESE_03165 [Nanobdellota archaeon]